MTKPSPISREAPASARAPDQRETELLLRATEDEAAALQILLERRDAALADLSVRLSATKAGWEAARDQLEAQSASLSWRLTAPLRNLSRTFPNVSRLVRKAIKGVWWTLSLQLPRKLRERRERNTAPDIQGKAPVASLVSWVEPNAIPLGWYGAVPLRPDQLSPLRSPESSSIATYREETADVSRRYGHVVDPDGSEDLHRTIGSGTIARTHLERVGIAEHIPQSKQPPSFAIVTPFFRHLAYFRLCAQSVADLVQREPAASERVEWIVLNDDPSVSVDDLSAALPPSVLPLTRILADGSNAGIVARLNQGIAAARHSWIIFLDCDDELDPAALGVLDHYIALFPQCRYIASAMTDIDESGRALRSRFHEHPTTDLFESGMVASHLKAVRSDLIFELGGLDEAFSGVQDYDLALRAAAHEPLLQIPERLYRYRWHQASQTVARQRLQALLARAAKARFLRDIVAHDPALKE